MHAPDLQKREARKDLAGTQVLSRGKHAELVAIGIGHDHPADLALPDVHTSRPEGNETTDLGLLLTIDGSDVEMQPVLLRFRHERRTAPADLRTAVRRANRGLLILILIPDQRPAQRFAPEVPDLLRAVACKLCANPQSAR
jgi:hypothetical protein